MEDGMWALSVDAAISRQSVCRPVCQKLPKKKELFTGIEDMTLLVPSHWLESRVKQSFLQEYPTKVIYNGIDLDTYHPTAGNFRKNTD